MKRGKSVLFGVLIILFSGITFTPAMVAQVTDTRTITLRVAADEEFRTLDNWEGIIRRSVQVVSDIYEKNFRIRWKILDIVSWTSGRSEIAAIPLAEKMKKEVEHGNAEILLGFSGRTTPKDEEDGVGAPFGTIVLVMAESRCRYDPRACGDRWRQKILAHELAHLFGAFHVVNTNSVMRNGDANEFDPQTSKIILLMRKIDFSKGVLGIGPETMRAYTAIFNKDHMPREINSLTMAYTNIGEELEENGKLDEAIAKFKEAVRIDPNHFRTHNSLGRTLAKQGKLDLAIAEFREAVRLSPNNAGAHTNLGTALLQVGKLNEAIMEYREAVRIEFRDPEKHINLSFALGRQRKYDESISAAREAIRLNPNLPLAHFYLGLGFYEQRNLDEALTAFRESIQLKPDLPSGHYFLGATLSQKGKHEEAIPEFRIALKGDPTRGLWHYWLAWSLFKTEKYREAWDEAQQAEKLGYKVLPQVLDMMKAKLSEQ